MEGVKKIKSQKIQQNSLNEKIHFKPAKSLRFSPQSTPQLKAKSLRSLKPSFFPFFHAMIASSLYHEIFFFRIDIWRERGLNSWSQREE